METEASAKPDAPPDPVGDEGRLSRPDPAFYRRRRKRGNELCQILLRNGDIDAEHVRLGLKIQEERGGQIGRILIQMGICNERAIARALIKQVQLNHAAGRQKNVSIAARENPGLAGLDIACSPVRTIATLLMGDVLVLLAIGGLGSLIGYIRTERIAPTLFHYAFPALLLVPIVFALLNLYEATAPSPPEEIRVSTMAITAIFVGDVAVAMFGMQWIPWHVQAILLLEWALAVVSIPLVRSLVRHTFARRPWWGHPVVVLGAGKTGRIIVRALQNRPQVGLRPVVVLDDDRQKQGTLRASFTNDEILVNSIREVPVPSARSGANAAMRGIGIASKDVNQMAREIGSARDAVKFAGVDSDRAASSRNPARSLVDSERPPGEESAVEANGPPTRDSNRPALHDSNRPRPHDSNRPPVPDSNRSAATDSNRPAATDSNRPAATDSNRPAATDSNRPPGSDSNRPPLYDSNRPPTVDSVRVATRDDASVSRRTSARSRGDGGSTSKREAPPSSRHRAEGMPDSLKGARGQFSEIEGVPVIGGLELAPILAERLNIPYGILAMPGVSSRKALILTERAGGAFSTLLVIPDLFGFASLGVPAKDVAGVLGIEVRQQLLLPGPRFAKRVMDIAFTLAGAIFVAPIIGLLAMLIKLDSRGDVFYSQQRLGRDGQRFTALKFRTMHGDGEQRLKEVLDNNAALRAEYEEFHKLSFDPRVTRIGRVLRKYSLDELPQLWNVLRGEMSLVGPRPYLEREIPDMGQQEGLILRAMPGMTGMWQVSDRNATGFTERVKMDLHYVRNWSPWLDIYILARTISVVISGTGA